MNLKAVGFSAGAFMRRSDDVPLGAAAKFNRWCSAANSSAEEETKMAMPVKRTLTVLHRATCNSLLVRKHLNVCSFCLVSLLLFNLRTDTEISAC